MLKYRFTGQKQVELMSTFVPETFRGQGIAAVLSQVTLFTWGFVRPPPLNACVLQAAMDFLVEEDLKAHVSCWYIKKFIDEQPQQQYKDFIS